MTDAATCDTSILVAALVEWHPDHRAGRRVLVERVNEVPAHVLLECYSVLTRLPPPHRFSAADASALLTALPLDPLTLPRSRYVALIAELGRHGLPGGSTYDALIAETARHHGLHLLSLDRRARATYDAIGVAYTLV